MCLYRYHSFILTTVALGRFPSHTNSLPWGLAGLGWAAPREAPSFRREVRGPLLRSGPSFCQASWNSGLLSPISVILGGFSNQIKTRVLAKLLVWEGRGKEGTLLPPRGRDLGPRFHLAAFRGRTWVLCQCDLGQITSPIASVSSSVKRGSWIQ